MDQPSWLNTTKEILRNVRTISVLNLSSRLGTPVGERASCLRILETEGSMRIVKGKSCGTARRACTSCDSSGRSVLTGEEIVISRIGALHHAAE